MTYKGPSSLNVVSILFYLIIFGSAYGLWKYGPAYWEREEIISMVQSVLANAHRTSDGDMQDAIVNSMHDEFRYKNLSSQDVEVYRDESNIWVFCNVYYTYRIEHLFGREHMFHIKIEEKRRILDL